MNETEKILNEIQSIGHLISDTFLFARTVPVILHERAIEKSADYAEKNMLNILSITTNNKATMFQYAVDKIKIDGHIAEFGVFEGRSINQLSKMIYPKTIFGFDSFLGLKEDFPLDCPKGRFNLKGVGPHVNDNVTLVKGYFDETLPEWLDENPGAFSLINIDCDTYESTSFVLNTIGPSRIVPGTMILFDEYFGFYGWEHCEFKAWQEYCQANDVKYRYLAICHLQVLVEVL